MHIHICPVNCPLQGNCLAENIIYRADVSTDSPADSRFYLGLTSQKFKSRYASHKSSFTHERYSNSTTLSAYIWKLKAEGKEFTTRWSIASYAKPYHPLARRCHLCIKEKTLIARNIDDPKCLNLRSELLGKCRHKARWLLSSDVGWVSCLPWFQQYPIKNPPRGYL